MQLVPSPEQTVLRDNVHRYLTEHYSFPQRCAMLSEARGFCRGRWKALAQLGWLGIEAPEAFGGSDDTPAETAVVLDEFGRFLVPEPLLACATLPARLLIECADAEQRSKFLRSLVSGDLLFAVAHHEVPGRGAADFVQARATTLPGGRFLLTGTKSAAVSADRADYIIVSARMHGYCDDPYGISLFLLDPALPGVTRRNFRTIDGGSAADLTLQDVEVGADTLLGADGHANRALVRASEHFVVGACAEAVGIMDAVVKLTVEHLKTRRAYGSTLSTYQALQHRLADMLMELELSRSMLMRALDALSRGDDHTRHKDVAAARVLIGNAGRFLASSGIQLHGAMGVVEEYIVGHYLKRLNVLFALCGSATFHLRQYSSANGAGSSGRETARLQSDRPAPLAALRAAPLLEV
jgi:alkylation response protein AidB-like acyl-CoA dehydrogenase